jgi:two-component sensor histidine kinase
VGDNGVGFPQDVDFRNTESLGMQLVNTLVHQLDGTLELFSQAGTEFKIAFPTPDQHQTKAGA